MAGVALALSLRDAGATRHAQLKRAIQKLVEEEAARSNWGRQGSDALRLLDMDIELNAQGLGVWLDAMHPA